jgi:predicted permease
MPVLLFAIAGGLATILLFSLAPASSFARTDSGTWMRGGRTVSAARSRAHGMLVAGEVALAVMLVAGASLFGETLLRMTSEPTGFRADHLVVVSVRIPRDRSVTSQQRAARNDALASQLAALPGAESATVTSTAPFSGSYGSNGITLDNRGGEKAESSRHVVSDTYFTTLGIPIVKGRGFDATDQPGRFAAVVTDEFERTLLDGDYAGKRFTLNGNVHDVIGVVPATKHRRYSEQPGPAMYILNRQLPNWSTPQFIVRTRLDGPSMLAAVRKTVEAAEPSSSIVMVDTMAGMMRRTVAEERFRAQLSIAFGGTALLLAGIGLYGLIARLVSERRREIGVRLAIGAPRSAVVRLVLRHAMLLVFAGLVLGVPAALAAAGLVQSMLYGVTPAAPHTFVGVIAILTTAAVAAAGLPAIRAANTDPATVLRTD